LKYGPDNAWSNIVQRFIIQLVDFISLH